MPTYPYACTACDHRFEQVQAFSDPSLTECPECGGRLRKVFSSVGIVFKGSGFYRNDAACRLRRELGEGLGVGGVRLGRVEGLGRVDERDQDRDEELVGLRRQLRLELLDRRVELVRVVGILELVGIVREVGLSGRNRSGESRGAVRDVGPEPTSRTCPTPTRSPAAGIEVLAPCMTARHAAMVPPDRAGPPFRVTHREVSRAGPGRIRGVGDGTRPARPGRVPRAALLRREQRRARQQEHPDRHQAGADEPAEQGRAAVDLLAQQPDAPRRREQRVAEDQARLGREQTPRPQRVLERRGTPPARRAGAGSSARSSAPRRSRPRASASDIALTITATKPEPMPAAMPYHAARATGRERSAIALAPPSRPRVTIVPRIHDDGPGAQGVATAGLQAHEQDDEADRHDRDGDPLPAAQRTAEHEPAEQQRERQLHDQHGLHQGDRPEAQRDGLQRDGRRRRSRSRPATPAAGPCRAGCRR